MVDTNRKIYIINGLKTIIDNDGRLWLNEYNIEERLDHRNLQMTMANIFHTIENIDIN